MASWRFNNGVSLSQADMSHSQLGASQVSLSQAGISHSQLGASQVSLSQAGTSHSQLGASQVSLSQADVSHSQLGASKNRSFKQAYLTLNYVPPNIALSSRHTSLSTRCLPSIALSSRCVSLSTRCLQVSLFQTDTGQSLQLLSIQWSDMYIWKLITNSQFITNQTTNRCLINFATGTNTEPKVAHDRLNVRTMGQKDYEIAVQHYFFKNLSIKFQKRIRRGNCWHSPQQTTNRGLINFVTGANTEPNVAHDRLNACTMGQKDYEIAVQHYFFKNLSIKFQKRIRRGNCWFTSTKKKNGTSYQKCRSRKL